MWLWVYLLPMSCITRRESVDIISTKGLLEPVRLWYCLNIRSCIHLRPSQSAIRGNGRTPKSFPEIMVGLCYKKGNAVPLHLPAVDARICGSDRRSPWDTLRTEKVYSPSQSFLAIQLIRHVLNYAHPSSAYLFHSFCMMDTAPDR